MDEEGAVKIVIVSRVVVKMVARRGVICTRHTIRSVIVGCSIASGGTVSFAVVCAPFILFIPDSQYVCGVLVIAAPMLLLRAARLRNARTGQLI
jgi:hypothetical protein